MQDPFPLPSCFFSVSGKFAEDEPIFPTATRSGESIVTSVYRTKIAGQCRHIIVTWYKSLLSHGVSISISLNGSINRENSESVNCKIELRPWHFWRKNGSKRCHLAGNPVDVFWDLRHAKFPIRDPEPVSDYYVAVVSEKEVVLLLGDLKKDAYRRSKCPPSIIEAVQISRKEHLFGKKRFTTRAKFDEKGEHHEILIECSSNTDPEMLVKIDGTVAMHVKHLQWKFRGNESISINKLRVEVYWDAHDWLFLQGLRHALFIFKPVSSSPSCSSSGSVTVFPMSSGDSSSSGGSSSGSCLFVYAWKVE